MDFGYWGTGRCVNCGLLGKRASQSTLSVCYEATAVDRLGGHLTEVREDPVGPAAYPPIIHTHPWCFLGKADLLGELAVMGAKEHQADKVLELIRKDRNCKAWYPWREFLSPKEHWEEQIMLAMEERREKFEQSIEKDRKDFELKLFEMNQRLAKDSHRVMVWLAIAAIIFAVAEVGAALLNYFG